MCIQQYESVFKWEKRNIRHSKRFEGGAIIGSEIYHTFPIKPYFMSELFIFFFSAKYVSSRDDSNVLHKHINKEIRKLFKTIQRANSFVGLNE